MHPPLRFDRRRRIAHPPGSFSVVSFNILSQSCLDEHAADQFAHVDAAARRWPSRLDLLVDIITTLHPFVVCLQEVDRQVDVRRAFIEHNYDAVFQDRKKGSNRARFVTAILFDREQFELDWAESRSRVLLVALRWRSRPITKIYIGNMHLQASPLEDEVRLQQATKALHRIEAHMAESDQTTSPIVLCGDFNDDDDSNVANMLYGKMEPHTFVPFTNSEHFMNRFGTTTFDRTTFPSYYSSGSASELDFVFYTATTLIPLAALHQFASDDEFASIMEGDPPPNALWPSDHMPVGCLFTLQTNAIIAADSN